MSTDNYVGVAVGVVCTSLAGVIFALTGDVNALLGMGAGAGAALLNLHPTTRGFGL